MTALSVMICPDCGGTGHATEEEVVQPDRSFFPRCLTCLGEGTVPEVVECVECAGQGWWKMDGRIITCRVCSGSGKLS